MINRQMEMSFAASQRGTAPRPCRRGRAQWWFQHMRQLVDQAMDWAPAPQPRPEQIWFTGTYRQAGSPAVPPAAPERALSRTAEERHLVE